MICFSFYIDQTERNCEKYDFKNESFVSRDPTLEGTSFSNMSKCFIWEGSHYCGRSPFECIDINVLPNYVSGKD